MSVLSVRGVPGGPGDMVTAVVTATPAVFGGKMPWTLGDSGPPWSEPGTGAGGDHSPGVRPVCVSGQEHAHRVQCCSDHAECASRGARALSLPGHSPKRVSWRSACHRSVTLRDGVRDSCVTSHDSVTSLITVIVITILSPVSLLLPGIPTNI